MAEPKRRPWSYTRLFAWSVVPLLLIFVGVGAWGSDLSIAAVVGVPAQLLVLARFLDSRRKKEAAA